MEQIREMGQEASVEQSAVKPPFGDARPRWAACGTPRTYGSLARACVAELPAEAEAADECPPEVDFILSALEAGGVWGLTTASPCRRLPERRGNDRAACRTPARVCLHSDGAAGEAPVVYTRDLTAWSLGFITRHRLPLGYGGRLRLRTPAGREVAIECVIRRCRETVLGWYEGAVSFNFDQQAVVDEWSGRAG